MISALRAAAEHADSRASLRKWCFILFLCIGVQPGVNAQVHGLEVRAVEREQYSYQPRQMVTLAFSVRNGAGAAAELESRLSLPPRWRTITPSLPFSLAANESAIRFVSFLIPENAAAGDYAIGYTVRHRSQPAAQESFTVKVRVLPVLKLHASLQDMPDIVPSGEGYKASFVLRNDGNAPVTLNFKGHSSLGHTLTPDEGRITLAAGESREVAVQVKTEIARQLVLDVLTLEVADADAKITERTSRTVKLLPHTDWRDRYRTIPAALTFRYVTQDRGGMRQSGWQTEFSGQGALDEKNTQRIGFLIRSRDQRGVGAFGMMDEYRLDYFGKNLAFTLGDQVYSLSPLTEAGRYGRGARGTYQTGNGVDLNFYQMEDRFGQQADRQSALGIRLALDNESQVGLNYLSRNGAVQGEILGLRMERREGMLFGVDGEVAHDLSHHGTAIRGQVYDARGPFRYSATLLRSPPGFFGYYRDQSWLTGGFEYSVAPQWTIHSYALWQRGNLARAAGRSAPDEKWLTLGANYQLSPGDQLAIDYFARKTTDLQPQPSIGAVHHALRLGTMQGFNALNLTVSGEWGYTENQLQGARFPTSLYLVAGSWQATDRQFYSVQLSRDNNAYSSIRQPSQTAAGLGVNYRVSDRTWFFLFLQGGLSQQSNTSCNVSFQHEFATGHRLQMLFRRSSGIFAQTDAMVSYAIPFGLPVGRKKNVAAVGGRLFDAETGGGIPNTALDLGGMVAVTDAQGRFSFPAAPVGKQYLSMIRDGGDVSGRVPLRPLPAEVSVQEGPDNRIDVAMVRAGAVAGEVMVYEPADQLPGQWNMQAGPQALVKPGQNMQDFVAMRGLASVLVILRNGEREVRRLTDSNGHFHVAGLPMGRWHVSVEAEGLPAEHGLAQTDIVVDIKPDQEATANFRVVPRIRKLQMLPPLKTREGPAK